MLEVYSQVAAQCFELTFDWFSITTVNRGTIIVVDGHDFGLGDSCGSHMILYVINQILKVAVVSTKCARNSKVLNCSKLYVTLCFTTEWAGQTTPLASFIN